MLQFREGNAKITDRGCPEFLQSIEQAHFSEYGYFLTKARRSALCGPCAGGFGHSSTELSTIDVDKQKTPRAAPTWTNFMPDP